MWDDVVIGQGNRGNSAIYISNIEGEHSISENQVSFWINHCCEDLGLDIGATIFKDTIVGQKLSRLIIQDAGLKTINRYIDDQVLEAISVKKLKEKIKQAVEAAYNSGHDAKASEIRLVLGIS